MITPEEFKSAFRLHPAGVALITADPGGSPVALTASSVSAVSADPPLAMFSVSALSSSARNLRKADSVVIHLLSADNLDLALLGAASGVDRFADESRWHRLPTGEPVFEEVKTWMRADILHRVDAGGSNVFVVTIVESRVAPDAAMCEGLVYRNRTWHRVDDSTVTSMPELIGASAG